MMPFFRRLLQTWNAFGHGRRAWAAYVQGRLADATREAEAMLDAAPDNPEAQFLLAQIYVADARHADARVLLNQVVLRWPDDAAAWYALGVCCDYGEEYHAAARAYKHTLKLAPRWLIACKHLGRCAWRSGERDLARRALTFYCAEAPDDEEAHDLLGYLEYEDGHLRQSFSHYAQASRLDPLNPKRDRNARLLYRRSALS